MFGDNPDAVGKYSVEVIEEWVPHGTEWTLTAEVRGEVLWIERGVFDGYISSTNNNFASLDWDRDEHTTYLEIDLEDASRYEC